MEAVKTFNEKEVNQHFAVKLFDQCWPLLEKTDRTEAESQELIHMAHASLYHWLQVGKPINRQRGQWMLARVYTVVGVKEEALYFAQRCFALTEEHNFKDFDLAYAYEAMARAYALNDDKAHFQQYYKLAQQAGEAIEGEKDKEIFQADLKKGPWFGLE